MRHECGLWIEALSWSVFALTALWRHSIQWSAHCPHIYEGFISSAVLGSADCAQKLHLVRFYASSCTNVRGIELRYIRCITWGRYRVGPVGHGPSQNFGWVGHNAFDPTNNWPVCSLILHCGQLILRKISKIGASNSPRSQLLCCLWLAGTLSG